MSNETKILGIIAAVTILILGGGIFFLSRGQSNVTAQQSVNAVEINYLVGQKIGSDSAKVKLVEFSDFQCPACLAAEPYVEDLLKSDQDKFQFIYRHFPLMGHKFSRQAVTVAEEAGKEGKFWQMHDLLFKTQSEWASLQDPTDYFLNLAKEVGVSQDNVKKALAQNSDSVVIERDLAEGRKIGVGGTPTFFLNGKKLELQNFNELKTAVDKALISP